MINDLGWRSVKTLNKTYECSMLTKEVKALKAGSNPAPKSMVKKKGCL